VIAVGAGSGKAGDAAYTVYFYGLMASSPDWGIFRSTNGGAGWDRVSYYPTGIYDVPRTMAASQDTFGKVYFGFSGNSFVYGQIAGTGTAGPPLPGAPTGLTATAVSGTEIDLAWAAASGTVTSYSVFRGTATGGESSTAVVTGLTGTTYADTSLSAGTKFFYEVADGLAVERRKQAAPLMSVEKVRTLRGFERLQDLLARMTVAVVESAGDDGPLRRDAGQKLGPRGSDAAVMADFEQRAREPGSASMACSMGASASPSSMTEVAP
jgi:hypothetical protein